MPEVIVRRLPNLALWAGVFFAALLLLGAPGEHSAAVAQTSGPGLPNRPFSTDQVYTLIGTLNAENGAPQEHSSVVYHKGYVAIVYSEENSQPRAGISFYDFSDPTQPALVARTEKETGRLSEQHAIAFSHYRGRDLVALLAVDGIEIWDWTDVSAAHRISRVELPDIFPGYTRGAWWLAWQGTYIFVSGAANGLYVVNTTDPERPALAQMEGRKNPIPIAETGGFRNGSVFAIGNLLVMSSNDGRGFSTLDIGNPLNPLLLDANPEPRAPSYSIMVNGNRIYAVGTDDDFHTFDISDPTRITLLTSVPMLGRGGYVTIQDRYAHIGASRHYAKIDMSDERAPVLVGTATSSLPSHDEDFAVPLGNLVVVGDDHYNGSFIFPHQAEPDRIGPEVNMVSPADGATGQPRSTRIGVTFTDAVDLRTVNGSTFVVRELDGSPLPGRYSTQTGIVNFAPDEPLAPNKTYEVLIPAGGIRDISGNPITISFRSIFSTGEFGASPLACEITAPGPTEIGRSADFQAVLTRGAGDARFAWDFGDGSTTFDPVASPATGHVFTQPGHYTVRVTVTREPFQTRCSTFHTAYRRTISGRAASATTILLDSSGTQVWVVNPDNDTVTAINAVTMQKMFEQPTGKKPRTLAQSPDGTIWVANQDDATISLFDPDGGHTGLISLPPGSRPYAVVFSPDGTAAYVSLQATGMLARIDPHSRRVVGTLPVGPTPRAIAISPDSQRIFVTRFISPDHQGEVVEVSPGVFTVRSTIPLAFDPGPDTESSGRGVPNALYAAAVSPDGARLWVASKKDNIARGLTRDGLPLNFESTVRAIISQVDLSQSAELIEMRHDFNNREGPVAVVFSPMGDYAFIALQGSNAIEILDAYSAQLVAAIENAGRAPQGIALTLDGSKLFVHSWLTRSVIVYDVTNIIRPGNMSAFKVAEISTVANDKLSPEVLQGKRIFYNAADPRMSRDGYLACSSCHLDERDDGRVWDRMAEGEGLRNTISLMHGPLAELGRIHWSANFDEMQDFEGDMRLAFGGLGFLPDAEFAVGTRSAPMGDRKMGLNAELDALAAYVNSLSPAPISPYRNPDGTLTDEAAAGRQIFDEMWCPVCHAGPHFTDSASGLLHDVGTLTTTSGSRLDGPLVGLDTPPLVGLWESAPYLHDGSAATLRDVLTTKNPNGIHADLTLPAASSDDALDKLIAYLLQIDSRETPFIPAVPAIEFLSPTPGQTFEAGRPIPIAVNTSTLLGAVERVEFYARETLLGEHEGPLYTFEWRDAAPGAHEISARLVYSSGLKTTSKAIQVQVR